MKNLIIVTLFILASVCGYAQDIIVKKDLSEIKCKVSEIGTTEIKYKKWENLEGPSYTIKKSEVNKIKFENGTEELIQQNDMSVVPTNNRNYKRAFTTRPFSLLQGHFCIGYQHAIKPTQALVGEIGWIGPRIGNGMLGTARDAKGAYGRVGFRLKRTPEVVMEGMEWGYNLAGWYVQPEISYSLFDYSEDVYDQNGQRIGSEKITANSGAFLITIGRQMIVGEVVTFDLSASVGYGFRGGDKTNSNGYEIVNPNYFSHNVGGEDMPIAWNFTLSMGFLAK